MNREIMSRCAEQFGTPCYVFDADVFEKRANTVKASFGDKVDICYSIKANPFLLKNLPDVFKYIEVCSPGELSICENINAPLDKVIFSGVNKTKDDVLRAFNDNVAIFTAESPLHLQYINDCALRLGKKADVILRLSNGNQFGMDESDLRNIIANRADFGGVDIIGLHYFTGTQKNKAKTIQKELDLLDELCVSLKADYDFTVRHVEYGTGLAVEYYKDMTEATDLALLNEIAPIIRAFAEKYSLTVEMGRFFAAECGTYLTKVMDLKRTGDVDYAICDGGINHLNYYGQNLAMKIPPICVLGKENAERTAEYSLCGSLCTTADVLVRKMSLPPLETGDVIAFSRCGAYSVAEGIAAFLSRTMPRVAMYSEKNGLVLARDFFETHALNTPSALQ